MEELLTTLKSLPKELLEWTIFQLMLDGKIEYHDLTEMHIQHLEALRKGQSEHYDKLRVMIVSMHCDAKKNHAKNLGDIMHYLLDCGEVNMTHEEINKRYGRT